MAKPLCQKYQFLTKSKGSQILPFDQPSCKDEESPADYNAGGYLPVKVNDTFKDGRYKVVRKLGWGHFSTVWLVKDAETSAHSALKVVKSAGRYAETARDEIKLLSRVASVSPNHPGRQFIVSFLDSFSHQSPESAHICIVFEPLGENLLALIERNKKKGVPRALVKVIAKQILLGLQYLHDECDLVHTDIKPENILISIPDIEDHINHELLQSPSPTSRRVGVPLPGKSKAGVTIPYTQQQRARRQVQIFDSQPLSSPSRSMVRSLGRNSNGGQSNLLMTSRAPGSISATTSQSNSYVTQMKILRNSSALSSSSNPAPGSLGHSFLKTHGNPATSLQDLQQPSGPGVAKGESSPPSNAKAPSTASSSSSVSSAAVSTPAGGSLISTPPTSLSQSMTGSGFLNKSDLKGLYIVDEGIGAPSKGIPIQLKGKDRDGLSPRSSLSKPASWVDHTSCSLSSSYKGSPLKSSKTRSSRHGHSHSQSGAVNAPWQVPSASSPAPVVLVNAVVGADGQDSGLVTVPTLHTSSSSTSTVTLSHSASESSSTAATVTQPSPTGTPLGTRKNKTMSIINGVSKLISDTSNMFSGAQQAPDGKPVASSSVTPELPVPPSSSTTNPVSLLTQTAPTRIMTTPASPSERTSLARPSPPQHTSQLSAHMHTGPCHSLHASSGLAEAAQRPPTSSRRLSRPNITTSISVPRHDDSPAPPPPTPIDGPQLGSFSTHEADTLPPIDTSGKNYAPSPPPISIKIADLGNATPSKKHYTEDIQTRQYRAPEAIVGRKDWDARADVWSVACLIFELLASEYLFDPQGQGELFTKDDDHMAQIIELVGDFSLEVKMGGKYSRELFDHTGALRYIKTLKPWPLKRVMAEKYLYSEGDAVALCDFLLPMLKADWRERANARDMLDHPWLDISNEEEVTEW